LKQKYTEGDSIMEVKQGRPREFSWEMDLDNQNPELHYVIGFLQELCRRVEDQIVSLPDNVMNFMGPNSSLSIGRLVLHLIDADLNILRMVIGESFPRFENPDRLEQGKLSRFNELPGDLSYAKELLPDYIDWRKKNTLALLHSVNPLDKKIDHPYCKTGRQILAHLTWHWSYHSGQIGLIAMEAGYDYVWTSKSGR